MVVYLCDNAIKSINELQLRTKFRTRQLVVVLESRVIKRTNRSDCMAERNRAMVFLSPTAPYGTAGPWVLIPDVVQV